jgi:predicted ribosome quality control (RQC) complex YloA/Tae2 family protein
VGATIGGGYQVPDWNKDSKPITIGGSVNLALIVGVKTEGTVTVDVDPAYDAIVETNNKAIDAAAELLKTQEAQRLKDEAEEAQRKLDAAAAELKRQSDAAAEALRLKDAADALNKAKKKANPKKWF